MSAPTGAGVDVRSTATSRAALLVIDLQTDMFSGVASPPIHDAEALVARTRTILEWARRRGLAVAFIRHDGPEGDPLARGAPGWPVWPALGQRRDEPTFDKSVGDAFSQAALGEWLARGGVDAVILLGAQTECCVAATVRGALERGLHVTVVGDAHGTWDSREGSATALVARHNAAFAAAGAQVVSTDALTSG